MAPTGIRAYKERVHSSSPSSGSGRPLVSACALALAFALGLPAAAQNGLGRDEEPIVVRGAEAAALLGAAPDRVVAFRRDGTSWTRIPVQVDERVVTTYRAIYGNLDLPFPGLDEPIETYADAGTYVGADSDPTVDADDEIVFLAGDAGSDVAPDGAAPGGVVPDRRVDVTLTHPDGGAAAHVYLFVHDGTLPPFPTAPAVAYDFVLVAGTYPDDYDLRNGPNPENSTVTAPDYAVHFSDRWIRDETAVTAGGATGIDVLDRHKSLFAPGDCRRSEDTFSAGEGAFLVNREGPVRALRGYMGANSGPTSHRIHAFYASREEIRIVLRVHAIDGVMDFWDHSPDASGMTYANDLNPTGVVVDGAPDAVSTGALAWERISGTQGTIAHVVRVDTDIPGFTSTSYYSDDATPSTEQCTGDAFEYGAAGFRVTERIPNTDPGSGDAYRFVALRVIDYDVPGGGNEVAIALADAVDRPLAVTWRSGGGTGTACADDDRDGFVDCASGCTPATGDACGDCAPTDGQTYPGAPEVCDGTDRDCSGMADDPPCGDYDLDGDGRVDGADLAFVGRAFGESSPDPGSTWWAAADIDDDLDVDGDDLSLLGAVWARTCGPGGTLDCSPPAD